MRKLLTLLLLLPLLAHAGSITGNIQTASSGAVVNGTFTFIYRKYKTYFCHDSRWIFAC
ncbi:MAG: hypothetical protein ACXV5R_00155 [Candidatus Angelobacter sp.]